MKSESGKISIVTIVLILVIIICCMLGAMVFLMNKTIRQKDTQIAELTEKMKSMQAQNIDDETTPSSSQKDSENDKNSIKDKNDKTTESTAKTLTDKEKKKIFESIFEDKFDFARYMLEVKDYTKKDFTDLEIIKLLPLLETSTKYFTLSESNSELGDFYECTEANLKTLSEKYFGKTVDTDVDDERVEVKSKKILISVPSDLEKEEVEMISMEEKGSGYEINFEVTNEDSDYFGKYVLNIELNGEKVVYKSLKKATVKSNSEEINIKNTATVVINMCMNKETPGAILNAMGSNQEIALMENDDLYVSNLKYSSLEKEVKKYISEDMYGEINFDMYKEEDGFMAFDKDIDTEKLGNYTECTVSNVKGLNNDRYEVKFTYKDDNGKSQNGKIVLKIEKINDSYIATEISE